VITFVKSTIRLRDLVPSLDPAEYKLHCAIWNGHDHPLDVFARSWEEWVGWNTYRPAHDEFNRRFIFSLIDVYDEPEIWLFGGAFEVVGRRPTPHSHAYDVELRENLIFALLEFWSMRTPDDHVIERERYGKRVLLSREFGHNQS